MTVNRAKAAVTRPPISRPAIKRRIGYENSDEDMAGTQQKFINMDMNDRE